MDHIIKFKEYTFTYESGTLVRLEENGKQHTIRLAPQPSKLLFLLLQKQPSTVSHEEIKSTLWPDVQIDFEKSLHFCIRQIRAALNDNAADPKYIQTVTRRGYKWIGGINNEVNLDTINELKINTAFNKSVSKKSKRIGLFILGTLIALVVIFGFTKLIPILNSTEHSKKDLLAKRSDYSRIAIMPFEVSDPLNEFAENTIAFGLLEQISNEHKKITIVGPTTTSTLL